MTPIDHPPTDASEILTSRRPGAAISTLTDPNRNPTKSVARLDEHEQHAIHRALNRSSHPIVAVAHSLLDQRDRLADDEQTACLLLFAQLTRSRERQRGSGRGMGR